MDYENREALIQGRRNQMEANETPQSFAMENGVARTGQGQDLTVTQRNKRMAGEMGVRAIELMNDPEELERTMGWMAAFGQSNQGMEWNMAKMEQGMPT